MFLVSKNSYCWLVKSLITACLILITPAWVFSANAKKSNHSHGAHGRNRENFSNTQHDSNYLIELNQVQKINLINLLRGRNSDDFILNNGIEIEIEHQINSLPPGIQKRLAKGKPLPYGIAKKVILPREVNDYLHLSQDYRIVVLGSSVIVFSSSDNIILDIFENIF
jgi:hypothetical protein